ncbi:MAG: hypothetical protein P4L69_24435 [Desulfosporosinus sp.]|nr:hypothetical protein [Desulfosporosinus sp.]
MADFICRIGFGHGGNCHAMTKKIKTAKHHSQLPGPSYLITSQAMAQESDRGCAIIGTAYLDILLRSSIEHQIRPMADLRQKLFENRGAMQDFSARITIAYAFKIIGHGAYADLNIMREIRNAFAHGAEVLSFDRDDIGELCRALWYPANVGRPNKPPPDTTRGLFVLGVEHLSDGLFSTTHPALSLSEPQFIHWGTEPAAQPPSSPKKPKERARQGHQSSQRAGK